MLTMMCFRRHLLIQKRCRLPSHAGICAQDELRPQSPVSQAAVHLAQGMCQSAGHPGVHAHWSHLTIYLRLLPEMARFLILLSSSLTQVQQCHQDQVGWTLHDWNPHGLGGWAPSSQQLDDWQFGCRVWSPDGAMPPADNLAT